MFLAEELPKEFYEHFAAWLRIEPRCRDNDFSQGLEARTADPLWMLTRQWQFGEFSFQDAGSPIDVELQYETADLYTDLQEINGRPAPLSSSAPLETLVERDEVDLDNWRIRVQIGQKFENILRAKVPDRAEDIIQTLRTQAPFAIHRPTNTDLVDIDSATQRYFKLMAGRVIDGKALLNLIRETGFEAPGIATALLGLIAGHIKEHLIPWFEDLYCEPEANSPATWQSEKLNHQFEVFTEDKEIQLTAPDYQNGDLDWHTFVAKKENDGGWSRQETKSYLPTRASFPGMPNYRWWAFEDATIHFGDLDVAKTDLAKMMLMEFALIYGDDWFMLPLELKTGTLARINKLRVTDTFGIKTDIEPAGSEVADTLNQHQRFELFTLADAERPQGSHRILLLPPSAGFREESKPIEEVRFLRDELANMVWGIEKTVRNGIGNPVDGFDTQLARKQRETDSPDEEGGVTSTPRYKLATDIPENWFPFIPARINGTEQIMLHKARMLPAAGGEAPEPITKLLAANLPRAIQQIYEEAVPRRGVNVQLSKQRLRWLDGKTYVWEGRKVKTSEGEGSSGLKYDVIRERKGNS